MPRPNEHAMMKRLRRVSDPLSEMISLMPEAITFANKKVVIPGQKAQDKSVGLRKPSGSKQMMFLRGQKCGGIASA